MSEPTLPRATGLIPISFSGAGDDLIHLAIPDDYLGLIDTVVPTDESDLLENSVHRYGGWLITPPHEDNPPMFTVWAHYNGSWSFSVGWPEWAQDDQWDFGQIPMTVRPSPTCSYSTELTVWVPPRTMVELTTEGAHKP